MPPQPQRRLSLSERIKDGRIFQKSGSSRDGRVIYLRCKQKTICQGTAKIVNGVIEDGYPHSEYCLPDEKCELICRFKEALSDALSRHWYRLKDLYDTVATVHTEAACHISYRNIRSFMQKCRKKRYPPSPRTVQEFVERLADPTYARNLEYNSGRLTVTLITDDSGAQHALFYDENFVRDEMSDTTRLFIDATFRSRPQVDNVYQLMTIMGIKLNHGFPFIWAVMTTKTQTAYVACLRYVKTHILHANNILLTMSDFERGLRNAISETFPSAHSTGCNTHYDRAVYKKARALGLQRVICRNEEAKIFFKKVLALAYLPAYLIADKFRALSENLSAAVKIQMSPFCSYFTRYWLGIVTAEGFSVHGLSRRTNNIIESYHSRLQHRMETRPGPWDFVCKLLKLQSDVRTDVQRLKNNVPIGRHARYSSIFKQRQLIKAWRELYMLEITVDEFLEKAASLKGNVDVIITRVRDEQDNDDAHHHELQERLTVGPSDPDFEREIFAEEPPRWLLDNAGTFPESDASDHHSDDDNSSDDLAAIGTSNVREPDFERDVFAEEPPRRLPDDAETFQETDSFDHHSDDDHSSNELAAIETSNLRDPGFERDVLAEEPPRWLPDDAETFPQRDSFDHHSDDDNSSDDLAAIGTSNVREPDFERDVFAEEPPRRLPDDAETFQETDSFDHHSDDDHSSNELAAIETSNLRVSPTPRRRRPRIGEPSSAPSMHTTRKNQKRNKRRKVMRRNAYERQRDAGILESASVEGGSEPMRNRQQSEETDETCKVCLLARATHLYWPCGHCCCCATCAERLWCEFLDKRCPICRSEASEAPRRVYQPAEC